MIIRSKNEVIGDMKRVFASISLPIFEVGSRLVHVDEELLFAAQIKIAETDVDMYVHYDDKYGLAGLQIAFESRVPNEKVDVVCAFLDLLNGRTPFYHYSICNCCNRLLVKSWLFVPPEQFPEEKFKRLYFNLIKNVSYCYPAILKLLIDESHAQDIFKQLLDDHDCLMITGQSTSKKGVKRALRDMESVFAYVKRPIFAKDRTDYGFYLGLTSDDHPESPVLRLKIIKEMDNGTFGIAMSHQMTVPDEKVSKVIRFLNMLNRFEKIGHFFIHPDTRRVILLNGIMTNEDHHKLDKAEFEFTLRSIMSFGFLAFSFVNELITSAKSPEVICENYKKECCIRVAKNQN